VRGEGQKGKGRNAGQSVRARFAENQRPGKTTLDHFAEKPKTPSPEGEDSVIYHHFIIYHYWFAHNRKNAQNQ
jgi:hypothetical protein